jgi:hypothetical protein
MTNLALAKVTSDRRLVIVQRNLWAARALARYLGRHFATVAVVSEPSCVEGLLSAGGVTDLVCGQRFGADEALGTGWIAGWRAAFPSLRCVVLATAEPITSAPGVDAVFEKPLDPSALLRFLLAEAP